MKQNDSATNTLISDMWTTRDLGHMSYVPKYFRVTGVCNI